MKCKICYAESGKYPLCRKCNEKKEQGLISKCDKCGNWHYTNAPCPIPRPSTDGENYLYRVRKKLVSKSEEEFFNAIKAAVPEGYCVFPQINLASFIDRTDDARYHNELFRNVDFLVTTADYRPQMIVEINDQTHLNTDRRERDEKVQKICEEAGIPILKLWTSYGVNAEYITRKISETLNSLPIARVHHFSQAPEPVQVPDEIPATNPAPKAAATYQPRKQKSACYVATCVYGSYDCPQVWVLRRFRDNVLAKTWYGRSFINLYYAISPLFVRLFGQRRWFKRLCQNHLDPLVAKLQADGFSDTPYAD